MDASLSHKTMGAEELLSLVEKQFGGKTGVDFFLKCKC